ncbi:glycosyltransferase family 4 protein [Pseudoalteromonas piscicida]|uniref:glycosyltransferase family 4 protein n=1 Tax=Pseudoalteromonas piscicida TaxID=43662 RepID=UPI001D09B881|nr:glycosyltransferase family 1 protein [Pseudoalteromonas piscicida]UDM62776.1 glycosyltransferase family 4 protein [Pseudoalteromonas piscicida]
MKVNIGIDASRNRSGGARAHIIGILESLNIEEHDIGDIHIWTYQELAEQLPKKSWIKVHIPKELNKSMVVQLYWQKFTLPKELKQNGVDILLSTDAGTVCRYEPNVVMSRDMLSFEPVEIERYFPSKSWLRLFILKYVQLKSIVSSNASIFLTSYARDVILGHVSSEKVTHTVIPHGISDDFRKEPRVLKDGTSLRFIYVSNADKYKHQWVLIEAFSEFLDSYPEATLTLVGANSGPCRDLVLDSVRRVGDKASSIEVLSFVKHDSIPELLNQHDVFIFASSCENMPNTLIEAMAAGLPILSSDRGPMPEVLEGSGILFNPEKKASIIKALNIATDCTLLNSNSKLSYKKALEYSWKRCANETFNYLLKVNEKIRGCDD